MHFLMMDARSGTILGRISIHPHPPALRLDACPVLLRLDHPDFLSAAFLAVTAAVIWGIGIYAAWRSPKYRMKLALFMFSPLLIIFLSNYVAPRRVLEGKAQGLYLAQFRDRIKPDSILVVHPNVMHAAAWEFRKSGLLFFTHGGELEYGLKYPDAKGRIINERQLGEIIRKAPEGKLIFIMRGNFREAVPPAKFEAYDHEIMFSNF